LLPVIAALIVLACAAASARRVAYAASPTSFDAATLVAALHGDDGARLFPDVCAAIRAAGASWESDLLEAFAQPAAARAAHVDEQLGELEWHVARWERVPRVCASVASTSGFLLAALVMRLGLADVAWAPADPETGIGAALNALVFDAVSVAALGMAGTAFCVACQVHARRAAKARLAAADKLVDRLEELVAQSAPSPDT